MLPERRWQPAPARKSGQHSIRSGVPDRPQPETPGLDPGTCADLANLMAVGSLSLLARLGSWAKKRRRSGNESMDIVSHGLWGGIAFGRASRRRFWAAFAFGVTPDLLAFGPHFVGSVWASVSGNGGPPIGPRHGYANIPTYVFGLYDVTHSLVVFAVAFLVVWAVLKRPWWPMGAWGLHVLMDIPTHSMRFFPTPFLWPLSNYRIDGVSWGQPLVLIPDLVLLAGLYLWYFGIYRRRSRAGKEQNAEAPGSRRTEETRPR